MSKCPQCGAELHPENDHLKHDVMCEETLCRVCNHCEFSNGVQAENCQCDQCSCKDINFGGKSV